MVLRLANIDKYNQYLRQVISRLPGVSATTTQVVIETIKDKLNIPLNDN
jgi:DNA-binding Lrp family transcriptional regulator